MRILIASPDANALTAFLDAFSDAGHAVHVVATAEDAAKAVADAAPQLCVVDAGLPDADPFALVARIMRQNAMVNTAVVSTLSDEDFHEAGEGLGILMRLPPAPGQIEADALLTALADLGLG
ncbi:response regulator transcription factor [Solidesulfovibrio alcoholivorans]|uniref:response regulator transcription factor n=1 Tax=Solidesulfovibrio alcoholivorans TaxID=81406 RepID=UPI0004980C58|nr:response regulator transcription factor [Solidesulfovibrio alcoholivorans]